MFSSVVCFCLTYGFLLLLLLCWKPVCAFLSTPYFLLTERQYSSALWAWENQCDWLLFSTWVLAGNKCSTLTWSLAWCLKTKHLGSCIYDGAEIKPKWNTLKGRGVDGIIKSVVPNFLLAMLRADVVVWLGKNNNLVVKWYLLCAFSPTALQKNVHIFPSLYRMDLNSGFIVKLPTRKEYFLMADAILACYGPVLVWVPPQESTCSIVLWNISACATRIFASRLFHPCQTAPRWHHWCFPALVKTALPLFMYCHLEDCFLWVFFTPEKCTSS